MNEEVADLLREGLALIEDEGHWTTEVYQYRRIDGSAMYCSIGALRKAAGVFSQNLMTAATEPPRAYHAAVVRLANTVQPVRPTDTDYAHHVIVGFNDTHTHDEVLGAFKQAIIDEETT